MLAYIELVEMLRAALAVRHSLGGVGSLSTTNR